MPNPCARAQGHGRERPTTGEHPRVRGVFAWAYFIPGRDGGARGLELGLIPPMPYLILRSPLPLFLTSGAQGLGFYSATHGLAALAGSYFGGTGVS